MLKTLRALGFGAVLLPPRPVLPSPKVAAEAVVRAVQAEPVQAGPEQPAGLAGPG